MSVCTQKRYALFNIGSQWTNYTQKKTNPILPQRENAIHAVWVDYFRFRTLKHPTISIKSLWIKPLFLTWCMQINTKLSRETITHNTTPTTSHQENSYNQHTSTQVTEDRHMETKGKVTISMRLHYTADIMSPVGEPSGVGSLQQKLRTQYWTQYEPARLPSS